MNDTKPPEFADTHLGRILIERDRVRGGEYGVDHDLEHASREKPNNPTEHLARELRKRLHVLPMSSNEAGLQVKTWVQVGQFALAALEVLEPCDCGQGPEPGEYHDWSCPLWDGTVRSSPCYNPDESWTPADLVREFHKAYGVTTRTTPVAEIPELALRRALLAEEAKEYDDAAEALDLVEIADGLADVVYVAYGTALAHGIDLDAVLAEVHRSNMSKLGLDGKPILRADGKVLKGPDYSPPDVASVLARQAGGVL